VAIERRDVEPCAQRRHVEPAHQQVEFVVKASSPSRYTEPPRRTETTVPSAARLGGASSSRCGCGAETGW
ncbi:hypothetical protein, partial [Inquilinus sp.]|uniref:hypothetical protein n=1 Tax=Inquilinus sp. TaxID=1932117 RepID=UPI0031CFAB82